MEQPPQPQRSGESPRRHHSEIDMSSLRRISEALLLAQNRARLATERANRCERVLRMVLTQVNPQLALSMRSELDGGGAMQRSGLLIDTASEWDMLQSLTQQSSLEPSTSSSLSQQQQQQQQQQQTMALPSSSPHRHHSFDIRGVVDEEGENSSSDDSGGVGNFECDNALWASMVAPERNLDVAILAKEIVENLRVAAARGDQRVQKLNESMPSGKNFVAEGQRTVFRSHRNKQQQTAAGATNDTEKNWLETWKHRLFRIEVYAMSPLQFVAGILVGVVVGMTVTKQIMLHRQGGSSSQLVKRLSTCYKRRIGGVGANSSSVDASYLPFTFDDDLSSYYVHPAAVEVA